MDHEKQLTPYELIGGETAISSLLDQFYYYMDVTPKTSIIRKMHSTRLDTAKQKLFKLLSGWLGGPDLYIQEYGHPRLKLRHFPFKIGEKERDHWMLCMDKALEELSFEQQIKDNLRQALFQLATHMINY